MLRTKRSVRKQAKAITRRRLNAQERHERPPKQAQRDIEALHQALHDLGLPDNLVTEIEDRLRAQKKLLGTIFGLMFPTLFGCINVYELTRTRGWDKHQRTLPNPWQSHRRRGADRKAATEGVSSLRKANAGMPDKVI